MSLLNQALTKNPQGHLDFATCDCKVSPLHNTLVWIPKEPRTLPLGTGVGQFFFIVKASTRNARVNPDLTTWDWTLSLVYDTFSFWIAQGSMDMATWSWNDSLLVKAFMRNPQGTLNLAT